MLSAPASAGSGETDEGSAMKNLANPLWFALLCLVLVFCSTPASSAGILTTANMYAVTLSSGDYDKIIGHLTAAEDLLDRGIVLLDEGKYEDAAHCFWRVANLYGEYHALKDHTNAALAYYYLGNTYLLAGRPDLAPGFFTVAADLYPEGELLSLIHI